MGGARVPFDSVPFDLLENAAIDNVAMAVQVDPLRHRQLLHRNSEIELIAKR